LHECNKKVPFKDFAIDLGTDPMKNWGGRSLRIMIQAIYIISFLCLLRFDEVLKIQAHHIEVLDEETGEISLRLPFRKTHQFGGKSMVFIRDFKELSLTNISN